MWIIRATSSLPEPEAAEDHDAAVGRRHLLDRLAQLRNGDRCADQLQCVAGAALQLGNLALQLGILQRAFGDQDQPVGLERLLDEIEGAALDRRDGGLDVAMA
ncbi:hypothetical protein ACVIEM_002891 [Rhizobium leguminosarum]